MSHICTLKPRYNKSRYIEFRNIAPILRIYYAYYIWYSELFDIVNKKGLTDLFIISRFDCIKIVVNDKSRIRLAGLQKKAEKRTFFFKLTFLSTLSFSSLCEFSFSTKPLNSTFELQSTFGNSRAPSQNSSEDLNVAKSYLSWGDQLPESNNLQHIEFS